MHNTQTQKGLSAMLMYALVTAASSLMIHDSNQKMPALLAAFYTFILCLFFYNLCSLRNDKNISRVKLYWREIFMLNATTAVCWICTFLSLKYISPELYLFIYLCAMPISASLMSKTKIKKSIFLILVLSGLILTYNENHLFLGVILSLLGGISGTIYSLWSRKVTYIFSTQQILSLRFYLLILITLFCNIYFKNFSIMHCKAYLTFSMLALVSVIIPLTLFQIGIKHLELNKALSFLPLAPLLCYAFNILFIHATLNILQIAFVLIIPIILLFPE